MCDEEYSDYIEEFSATTLICAKATAILPITASASSVKLLT